MFSGVVIALLGLSLLAFSNLFSGDDDPDPVEPEPPEPSDINAILVSDGTVSDGTDGVDLFVRDPDADGPLETTLQGGDGDDIFYLESSDNINVLDNSDVSGGSGDDVIFANAWFSTISGGAGDDEISGDVFESEVYGDAGDDLITVQGNSSGGTIVDGGAGDDTIDGRGSTSVSLRGGDGNDDIHIDGRAVGGTGNFMSVDGGAGDDTLRYDAAVFPLPNFEDGGGGPDLAPMRLTGGDGVDSYEINFVSEGGSFTAAEDDPDVFQTEFVTITDFEPGTEVVTINTEEFTGYSAEEARLEEDADAGETRLIVKLISDLLVDQEVVITLGATGVTWDDIAFVSNGPAPILVA